VPHLGNCSLSCAEGYLPTHASLFCNYGTLLPKHFDCLAECSAPSIEKATLDCDPAPLLEGTTCTIHCDAGYELLGSPQMSCEVLGFPLASSGTFVVSAVCRARECGDVSEFDPHMVQGASASPAVVGDTRWVSCHEGYRPAPGGTMSLLCAPVSDSYGSNVAWSGNASCEALADCGNVAAVNFPGVVAFDCTDQLWREGNMCTLTCAAHHQLHGSSIQCDQYGRWTGNGSCLPDSCAVPVLSENMLSACPTSLSSVPSGDTCEPTCSEGFKVSGTFRCHLGSYVEVASCWWHRLSTSWTTVVVGRLDFRVVLGEEELFAHAVQHSVSEAIGIVSSDVAILEVSVSDTWAAEEAGLASSLVEIDFEVGSPSADAETLLVQLTSETFREVFVIVLATRLPDYEIVSTTMAHAVVVNRTIEVDEYAQEEGDEVSGIIVGSVTGFCVLSIGTVVLTYVMSRRRRGRKECASTGDAKVDSDRHEVLDDNVADELCHCPPGLLHFRYDDVREACGGWQESCRMDFRTETASGTFAVHLIDFGQVVVRCIPAAHTAGRLVAQDWAEEVDLLKEVKHQADLRHPNLLQILGYSADGPEFLVVCPVMRGGSMDDAILDSPDQFPWYKRVFVVRQVISALAFLHARSLFHGNLKGSNVLLTRDRQHVRLSHAGLSMDCGAGVFATPASNGYVCEGLRSAECDVFALGVVCLVLVTSRLASDPSRPENPLLLDRQEDWLPDDHVWPPTPIVTMLLNFFDSWTHLRQTVTQEADLELLAHLVRESEQAEMEALITRFPGLSY